MYAEAGLTLKVEFTKQPSLLFVPNEPALHLEFVLSLKPFFWLAAIRKAYLLSLVGHPITFSGQENAHDTVLI